MNNLTNKLLLRSDTLSEMANIVPKISGLNTTIFSDEKGKSKGYQHHEIRIKVETNNFGRIPVSITKNGEFKILINVNLKNEDLNKINDAMKYVQKHWILFIKHWEGEITSKLLRDSLAYARKYNLNDSDSLKMAIEKPICN